MVVKGYHTADTYDKNNCSSRILIIGCGTSELPAVLLEMFPDVRVTLQDSSATCIDWMKTRHGDAVEYVTGDILELSFSVPSRSTTEYDVIVDKGLIDALLCGEGWSSAIEELIKECNYVLRSGGRYFLVSYRLPQSTQSALLEIASQVGWTWQFAAEGSNGHVMISEAWKQ